MLLGARALVAALQHQLPLVLFVRTFSAFALLSDIPMKVLPMRLFFTLSQLIIRILTPVSICNLMVRCDSQWCKKSYRAAQARTNNTREQQSVARRLTQPATAFLSAVVGGE